MVLVLGRYLVRTFSGRQKELHRVRAGVALSGLFPASDSKDREGFAVALNDAPPFTLIEVRRKEPLQRVAVEDESER